MQSMISMLALIVAVNVGVLVYARTATRQRRSPFERRWAPAAAALSVSCSSKHSCSARQPRPRASRSPIRHHPGFRHLCRRGNDALPYFLNPDMPLAAYVYVAMLTVFTAVVTGVLPALHATGRRAQDTLKQASGTDGLRLGRVWTAMIIAQVAIAVTGLGNHDDQLVRNPARPDQGHYNEESFLAATVTADPIPRPACQRPSMRANRCCGLRKRKPIS